MKTKDYLLLDEDDEENYGSITPIGKKPQRFQEKPKRKNDNVRKARKMKQQRQRVAEEEGE